MNRAQALQALDVARLHLDGIELDLATLVDLVNLSDLMKTPAATLDEAHRSRLEAIERDLAAALDATREARTNLDQGEH